MRACLPAAAKTLGAIGFKAYTTSRAGAKFHVTLFDPRTGAMAALVEADLLGQFRTGAASGVATKELARRVINRVRGHAEELGSDGELAAIDDLLQRGNGAARQIVVYEANHDLREVLSEIVDKTSA